MILLFQYGVYLAIAQAPRFEVTIKFRMIWCCGVRRQRKIYRRDAEGAGPNEIKSQQPRCPDPAGVNATGTRGTRPKYS
jgi:hypothetical protein